ncbi:MAG: leucine-rich repeat domain-containing protein [Bacilli bacterium]
MKKFFIIGITIFALLSLSSKNINGAATDPVSIPDSNLRGSINLALGRAINSSADITEADMATISTLDARGKGISDLTGVEYLVRVNSLYLSDNNITDISAVGKLAPYSRLTTVYLDRNELTDISALSNMIALDRVTVYSNNIEDLSPLGTLQNLSYLSMALNPVTDADQVYNIVDNISGVQILDLTGLPVAEETLISLKKQRGLMQLGLNSTEISDQDLEIIGEYSALNYLHLNDNQIVDVSPLSSLNLFMLNLNNNQITDISALSNMKILYYLYLNNNDISDISPLSNLSNLYELYLAGNRITDISSIGDMNSQIKKLDISNQEIILEEEIVYEPKIFDLSTNLYTNTGSNIDFTSNFIYAITEAGVYELSSDWYYEGTVNSDRLGFIFSGSIKKSVEYIDNTIESPTDGSGNTITNDKLPETGKVEYSLFTLVITVTLILLNQFNRVRNK